MKCLHGCEERDEKGIRNFMIMRNEESEGGGILFYCMNDNCPYKWVMQQWDKTIGKSFIKQKENIGEIDMDILYNKMENGKVSLKEKAKSPLSEDIIMENP